MTTWTILRTAPCAEFKARDELHRLDISALVPVEFTTQRYRGNRESYRKRPVIRGYVFASVGPEHMMALHDVPEIKGAVWLGGSPATLAGWEVSVLEALSQPYKQQRANRYAPGDPVRIKRGSFAEIGGIIDRIEKGRIVAVVEMFGKPCEVRLEVDQMEAA